MTTSGTSTFNETQQQIITNALSLLGVVAAGETVTTNDYTLCSSLLNQMVKAWMSQGIHLFTEEEGTLYLVKGQYQYTLPGANASDGSGTPVETSVSVAGNIGDTSITVVTANNMSVNDTIGIELSTSQILWTTITVVNSTTNVSINTSLPSVVGIGNQVFSYTTQCPRVLSIQAARLRDNNFFDRTIKILPRYDYNMIPQKTLQGDPICLYYSPQVSNGLIYIWPATADVSKRIEFTYLRTIQDLDNPTDNPDFPQEWLECVVYNLAVRIAPSYGINLSSGGISGNPDILRQAAQYLDDLKAWDSEQPYVQIVPGYRFNR